VFSDWLDEQGDDSASLLRWYANEVMPTVATATNPIDVDTRYEGPLHAWRRVQQDAVQRLNDHPQSKIIFDLGNVAFCRIDSIWNSIPDSARELVALFRLFTIGLASAEALERVHARERMHSKEEFRSLFGPDIPPVPTDAHQEVQAGGRRHAVKACQANKNRQRIVFSSVPALWRRGEADDRMKWGALHRVLAEIAPLSSTSSLKRAESPQS
jgi:hypothetical protein